MKMSNELALIVRLANTLRAMLDDMRAAADSSEDPSLAHSFLDGYTRMLNEAQHYINSRRPQAQGRVYLTDPEHIFDIGRVEGLVQAQKEVDNAYKQYGKNIPGIGLTKTIVDGVLATHHRHVIQRNLLAAIDEGLDIKNKGLELKIDQAGIYLQSITEDTTE